MKVADAIDLGVSAFELTVSKPGISHRSGKETPIFKRSTTNKKFGKRTTWRAGSFKNMPLYSLTLEERATCPKDCKMYVPCYGNNTPFATRFKQGFELESRIADELFILDERHPGGYSIRLHVLGDFYSVDYVKHWELMLYLHSQLHIFGYTHRTGEIEKEIDRVFLIFKERFNILQSDKHSTVRPSALTEITPGHENLITCPEQENKVDGCLDCGYCTLPNVKGVTFLVH